MVLLLIPVFLLCLITVLLLGGVSNLLYFALVSVAAGSSGANFQADFFLQGVIVAIPLACFVALIASMLFVTRKGLTGISPFIVLSAMAVGIFVFALPFFFKTVNHLKNGNPVATLQWAHGSRSTPRPHLSTGHFRKTYNGVYYFTKSDKTKGLSGVFYPSENSAIPEKTPIIFKNATYPLIATQSGVDPLIEQALSMPDFLDKALNGYLWWIGSCADNYSRNKNFYLQFSIWAIPVCILFLLLHISSWKMASGIFATVLMLLILVANASLHLFEDFVFVRSSFTENANLSNVGLFLSVILNGTIVFVLFVLKIFNIIHKRKRRKYR